MSQSKDLSLSMSGDAFTSLRSDFDDLLRSTIVGMIETEQDTAQINISVKITLTEDSAPDYSVADGQSTRSITKPKFEHKIQTVIQRKETKSDTFSGENELVWDRESGKYVARPIDDGQRTLFDDDEPEHVDLPDQGVSVDAEGPRELPEASVDDETSGNEDVPAGEEDGLPGDAGESGEEKESPYYTDTSKPFGWLRQFVGVPMHICEAMGNYTVRTDENKVVLSSATSPENPFYCPAEVLAGHVHDALDCIEGPDVIVIRCADCDEVLYDLDTPEQDDEDETSEEAPDDGYGYDAPEEEVE